MITVHVRQVCGCCIDQLQFENEESAHKAFASAGLGNGVEITDDAGVKHSGLDTFYGFSLTEEEHRSRGLGYLFDLAKTGGRPVK